MNYLTNKSFYKLIDCDGSVSKQNLNFFQKNAGIKFKNINLLLHALVHRSYSGLDNNLNNERLEFLGDSVLSLTVCEYLYNNYSDMVEGDLAKIKSFAVSELSLYNVSKKIGLDKIVIVGKGEKNSVGRFKKSIVADCLEAVIGAYFLDSGFDKVRKFILDNFVDVIESFEMSDDATDFKSNLQVYVQKRLKTIPRYRLVKKEGLEHDLTFFVEVLIDNDVCGYGSGKNKKLAEQMAAKEAFLKVSKRFSS